MCQSLDLKLFSHINENVFESKLPIRLRAERITFAIRHLTCGSNFVLAFTRAYVMLRPGVETIIQYGYNGFYRRNECHTFDVGAISISSTARRTADTMRRETVGVGSGDENREENRRKL